MYPEIPNKDFEPSFRPKCTGSQISKTLSFSEPSQDSCSIRGDHCLVLLESKMFFQQQLHLLKVMLYSKGQFSSRVLLFVLWERDLESTNMHA